MVETCPASEVWRIQKVIALHVHDDQAIEDGVRNTRCAPADLAHFSDSGRLRLWWMDPEKLAEVNAKEELGKWTPIVKLRKGGQRIPWKLTLETGPTGCQECTAMHQEIVLSEEKRMAQWNQSGWEGFSGRWCHCV
jgi:hypothetical protein